MALDFISPSVRAAGSDLTIAVSPLGLIELADEEFEVHGPRLTRYANAAAFYLGHHWAYRRPPGEPQITANYVAAFSDFLTNFTFSKSVQFGVDAEFTHITPALLDRIWDQDNRKDELLWMMGNIGSVYGDVFVKVAYEPAYENIATGDIVPGRVRILPLNPSYCFPEWHPHDKDRLIRFKLKYRFWSTSPQGTRMVNTYCVDDETEALTKRGWKTRTDLLSDDEFMSVDPVSKKVTWQQASQINVFDYDGPLAHWQSSQFDAMTTPNHRWMVDWKDRRNHRTGDVRFVTTENIRPSHDVLIGGGTPECFATEAKYSDEFVELVGWTVTEGHYQKNYSKSSPDARLSGILIRQTDVNPEQQDRLRTLVRYFTDAGATASEYDGGAFYFGKGVGADIRAVAPDKQLSPEFLCALTHDQALLLYKTLIDADGWRSGGSEYFGQKDQGRVDGFQMLCSMLGVRTVARPKYDGSDFITVGVIRSKGNHFHAKPEYVTEEHYEGKVWCPTIPETGTWLARRGGKVYWTGNCEIITDSYIEEYINDQLIDQRENPLGFIPVVHIANKPVAASPWGLSDIIDLIPLNRTLNEVATDVLDIINYHTAPITIITGAKASSLERGANKLWAIPQKDARVENLEGGFQGLPHALEFINLIKMWMHEMSGVPETALGKEQEISNTSGVALAIQYFPTMLKYNLKKTQYGNGFRKISQCALKTLFTFEPGQVMFNPETDGIQHDGQPNRIDPRDPQVYDIDCIFPPPLPQDELVLLNEIQAKLMLELESKKGALKTLGEQFPDEKLQELWVEQIEDLKMTAAKRIVNAQVDASIIALTGIVPQDAGEPVQGAQTQESTTTKPDGTKTKTTKQTTPGVQGPSTPALPSLPGLGDLSTLMNDMGGQTMKDLVVQAAGTKLPQRRIVDKNSNQ